MSSESSANRIVGAIPPPPGQRANFVDPPNHNAELIAQHTILLTAATIFVILRLYTRTAVLKNFGLDDVFVIAGWVFAVVYTAITFQAMKYGLGYHLWDVPAKKVLSFGEWLFIESIETSAVWCMIKLAYFWSYRRIWAPVKAMRWFCYGGMFVCSAFYFAQVFHDIFICIPVQKNWNSKLPGHCLPNGVGGSVSAIFNVITDFFIWTVPIPLCWSLQLDMRRKIQLVTVFALGAFVNAASITRLAITYLDVVNRDVSWKVYKQSLWSTLEIYFGLIGVCCLALPKYWEKVCLPAWRSLRGSSSGSSARSQNDHIARSTDAKSAHNSVFDKDLQMAV